MIAGGSPKSEVANPKPIPILVWPIACQGRVQAGIGILRIRNLLRILDSTFGFSPTHPGIPEAIHSAAGANVFIL
jgi:hypothetical protein